MDVKLKTGRNVKIRKLSIDKIDELKNIIEIHMKDGGQVIKNMPQHRTGWLRNGIGGGDFENKFTPANGQLAPDELLLELTEDEKDELLLKVQNAQKLDTKKK